MNQHLETCPACGQKSLLAICRTTVEYAIANDGKSDQDWSRQEVDDDDSTPSSFRCGACGVQYADFTLDSDGYLIGLSREGSVAPVSTPEGAMTAAQFEAWLTARVDEWCDQHGLTPHGEGCELGDLYRELDDGNAFVEIGVTLIPAYDEQTLYIVGPNASWLATTGIELGIESETIWHDPLSNFRLDVPLSDLRNYRDRLRQQADEITGLVGE